MKKKTIVKLWTKRSSVSVCFMVIALFAVMILTLSSYVLNNQQTDSKDDLQAAITVKPQLIADNLRAPTDMAFPGNETVWITEQNGIIKVIKNGKPNAMPLLDLSSKMVKVNQSYDERGLLGIALHPQFKRNGKFYVFYSAPTSGKFDHKNVVAEYKLLPHSDQADPNSARIILTADEPESNHNGGCIKFGPDGYLYVAFGDGGGAGDKHGSFGNGQKLDTWLGKILRIDINSASGYRVPSDNPFINHENVKPEIWAYGLRNPYRFSFDKATGQLFAGDVGQDIWEEVDIIKKGANYGWRLTEGMHCFNPSSGCDIKGITMPIAEYNHREGICIIGGYVYNGKQVGGIKGKYFFADWTGPVFYLEKNASGLWKRGKVNILNYPANLKITGFSEDPSGELYLLTSPDTGPSNTRGSIYKIVKN
jgi:glucose/arabinose dehydrogenase